MAVKTKNRRNKSRPCQKSKVSANNLSQIESYLNSGVQHHNSGNYVEAIENYQKALSINPRLDRILFNLGAAYQAIKNFNTAKLAYEKAVKVTPYFTDAWHQLGLMNYKTSHHLEAINAFEKVITLNPQSADAFYCLCTTLKDVGRFDDAIAAGEKAILLNPDHTRALASLGETYYRKGDLEQALTCYERVIALTPEDFHVLNSLGGIYMEQGRTNEAFTCFQKSIDISSNFATAYYNLATLNLQTGNMEKSQELYIKTLQLDPSQNSAYLNLAIINRNTGRTEQEIQYYQTYLKYHPESHETLLSLASAFGTIGKINEQIESYRLILSVSPKNIFALKEIARTLVENNLFADALPYIQTALEISTNTPELHYALSLVYANLHQPEQEIQQIQKAIDKERDCADLHFFLGNAFNKTGETNKAIETYKQSIKIDPGHLNSQVNLVSSLMQSGEVEEATNLKNIFTKTPFPLAPPEAPETDGKDLEIFLMLGQSNMEGKANWFNLPPNLDRRIFEYTDDGWKIVEKGTSLGLAFAKSLLAENPETSIGLINCAHGGSPICRWVPGGDLYQKTINIAKKASYQGRIKGILWHNGETDAFELITAQAYYTNLCQFISSIRKDLGQNDLPVMAGELGPFLAQKQTIKYHTIIGDAYRESSANIPRLKIVSSAGLNASYRDDNLHFSPASLKEFGTRYAKDYLDLIRASER
nr:tetratricopeptide repeat protein [Desulfobulbaceae bacterium]